MKRVTWTAVAMLAAAGCQPPESGSSTSNAAPASAAATSVPSTAPTTRAVLGLPAGWELVPRADYTARQSAGTVTITAKGKHNTGGFETKMFQSPLRIYPPQWLVGHKPPPPDAMVTQAITPFEVKASFKADAPIAVVTVTDAAGRHEVKVEQGD